MLTAYLDIVHCPKKLIFFVQFYSEEPTSSDETQTPPTQSLIKVYLSEDGEDNTGDT